VNILLVVLLIGCACLLPWALVFKPEALALLGTALFCAAAVAANIRRKEYRAHPLCGTCAGTGIDRECLELDCDTPTPCRECRNLFLVEGWMTGWYLS